MATVQTDLDSAIIGVHTTIAKGIIYYYDVIDDKKENLSGDFPADSSDPELENPALTHTLATNACPTIHETLIDPISGLLEPGPVILGKPEDENLTTMKSQLQQWEILPCRI